MKAHKGNLTQADPGTLVDLQTMLISIGAKHPALVRRDVIDEEGGFVRILEVWNTNHPKSPFVLAPKKTN